MTEAGRQRAGARRRSSGRSLWVLRDGKPVPAQVSVGVSDGTFTEVLSGPLEPATRF